MSTLELEHLKHTSSSSNNLSVHSDGSLTVGNLQSLNVVGNVGIGTTGPTHKLHVVGDVQAENASGHRSLIVKGNSTTNYQGGSLLLANSGMDTNYGGTYLYHHKAGGSGTQNAAFNISQRTAGGAYVSNIYNVDYQNNAHSFYVPNGGASGAAVLGIDGNGVVTAPKTPAFHVRLNDAGATVQTPHTTHTVWENQGGHWNSSTHRFVAPAGGFYYFILSGYTNYSSGHGYIGIRKNGTQIHNGWHWNINNVTQHQMGGMTAGLTLQTNDYVDFTRPSAGSGSHFAILNASGFLIG